MGSPKNITYEKIYNRALDLFNGDRNRTNLWWIRKSELFDNKAPHELVREGKGQKLMKIIERCGL